MEVVKLDSNNFKESISDGITLVDFYADWCGPCKMVAPFIEEVAQEVEDITIGKLDVDASADIAQNYDVMSIPTLIVYKDGEVVDQKMGFMTKEQIVELIDKAR